MTYFLMSPAAVCAGWPCLVFPLWGVAPTVGLGASCGGFPKPGAPIPRRGECIWGLEANSTTDQEDTDNDSVLLLRQMVLTSLAQWGYRTRSGTDSVLPSFLDRKCSSIWVTPAVTDWIRSLGLSLVHFDQCMLGQVAKKSTTIATSLPPCHCFIGTVCAARASMTGDSYPQTPVAALRV